VAIHLAKVNRDYKRANDQNCTHIWKNKSCRHTDETLADIQYDDDHESQKYARNKRCKFQKQG
jgi:hypothetical protein